MKKVLFIFGVMLSSFTFAQEVSKEVESAFHQKFPHGKNAKWEHKDHDFIVSFSEEDKVKTAVFDEHGKWEKTKSLVSNNEIPANITAAINEKHHESKIEKAYMVKTEKAAFFKVFIKDAKKESYIVEVGQDGKVLKSEKHDSSVDPGHKIN